MRAATRSGAHFVFHTASPYFLDPTDPQKQLLDPALKGTANVMGAVVKNKCGSAAPSSGRSGSSRHIIGVDVDRAP